MTTTVTAAGRAAAFRLMVATVATRQMIPVPGTTVGAQIGVAFGWQPQGHRLIADLTVGDLWQITVWRPGQTRLSTALAKAPYNSWPVIDQGPY